MPSWLGAPELIIVLIIVVLIFGVGRIANIGGELGKGISAFRKGIKTDEDKKPDEEEKKE
ncbi:MAG: preprotein translocase subunit TatA [Chloroflexi bacterium RBG_16_47_49]|nr:MAG: preprotein translocase subunit TatA [Chloroflexi bacterium RBG_16_47_49]